MGLLQGTNGYCDHSTSRRTGELSLEKNLHEISVILLQVETGRKIKFL
jgi:hypothetical protein